MPNPQNPELRRSEEGNIRPRVELGPDPTDVGGETGSVPPENQPGHHPPQEQDKPPADKFAEALGIKSDTELAEGDDAGRTRGRAAKKAASRKAAAKRAATGPSTAPTASPRRSTGGVAAKRAAETPVSPAPAPTSPPQPAATTSFASDAPAAEPAERAAEQHHHTLPDEQLPHDTGMVTPSGAPVTGRLLTWPLRYCGAALKTSGGVISAYGNVVRKLGERLAPGRR